MIKTTISYFDKQQQQVRSAWGAPLPELLWNQVWNWKPELPASTRLIVKDEHLRFKGIYWHRIAEGKWNKLDDFFPPQIVNNYTTYGHSYCIVIARYISWISICLYSWTCHRLTVPTLCPGVQWWHPDMLAKVRRRFFSCLEDAARSNASGL